MSQQPSGWYDDPSNPEMLRYWDGVTWTNHTAPKKSPTLSQPTAAIPQEPSVPQAPQPTTPMPQGGGWQGHNLPQQQYPPQYQQYPQAPGAQGWMTAGPSTADGVPLASWGKRLLAWILDGILITIVVQVLTPIFIPEYNAIVDEMLAAFETGSDAGLQRALSDVAGVSVQQGLLTWVVASVYSVAFWTTLAQTPGKMVAKISVRRTDRPGPLDMGTAVKRRLVPLLGSFVPLLTVIDGLWPLWDGKRQALHDKVGRTQVVVGKQPRKQA